MMTNKNKSAGITGTKEWAAENVNIQTGCEHDCRYCYAKGMALRFHRTTAEGWRKPTIRPSEVNRKRGQRRGTVMFPSTHDITPLNVEACIGVLEKMLAAGNRVLIVSKPHLRCVKTMCERLAQYRDRIVFRFTIGSVDDHVLRYWEPGAPASAERLASRWRSPIRVLRRAPRELPYHDRSRAR